MKMREKKLQLVITFATTTDAMAMDKKCREHQMEGRLIPLPRVISAGCGMVWKADIAQKAEYTTFIEIEKIKFENIYEVLI